MGNLLLSEAAIFGILLCIYNMISISVADTDQQSLAGAIPFYYNFNWMFVDRSYHYLNSAGITNQSTVEKNLLSAAKRSKEFENESHRFHGSNFMKKVLSLKSYYDTSKMMVLHIYDDPNDIKLAAGLQVNQQLCGLQLDYMLHKVNKHNHHITNSTDWSIFNIINSFGSPTFGLASGNTMFLGDYKACTSYKLSITKNELVEVNKTQAERFFTNKQPHTSDSRARKVLKFVKKYIAPFVGITETVYDSYDVIEGYQDKIRLQPTVYCVAGIRWPSWPNSTYHKRNVVLRVGVCLPDTCDSSSLDLYSDKIKRLMDIQIPDYYSGYYINNLYCLPDEKSPLRNPMMYKSTVLFLAFNAVWIVLIASATVAVYLKSRSTNKVQQIPDVEFKSASDNNEACWLTYLKCWCLISNYNSFIRGSNEKKLKIDSLDYSPERRSNRVDMSSLDGLKIVGYVGIVAAHSLGVLFTRGENPIELTNFMSGSAISGIMPLVASCVNFFFVITGFITSIRFLQMPKQTLIKPLFWLQFFIYRYLRIVPLYLFVHWAIQSYGRFTGSGPLWDYGTSSEGLVSKCQSESLWEVVFLTANFKSPTDHCNFVGWYLASDIQFSLITPLFIILFLKKPLVGHLTVLLVSLAVMVNHTFHYMNFLPETEGYLNFPLFLVYVVYDGAFLYVQPHYRCSAYFIGLSAGHLLLQYGRGKIQELSKRFILFGKVYIVSVIYILFFAGSIRFLLQHSNQPLLHFLGAIYGGSFHWFTSTAMALSIVLLCTGHLPTTDKLLSRNSLKIISASLLSPVLIHAPIIANETFSAQTLPHLSMYGLGKTIIILIILSFFAGSIFHILYEIPMRRFLIKSVITVLGGRKIVPTGQAQLATVTERVELEPGIKRDQHYLIKLLTSKVKDQSN